VSGGLSTGTVHVRSTNLNSSNPADYFVAQPDVTPSSGRYALTLQPGYVYTLTTTTGQGKGTATSPATHAMALPYADSFDSYPLAGGAKYLGDMQGAFEVRGCTGGRTGQCVQQVAPVKPLEWQGDSDAYALLGDPTWSNYTVSVDVNPRQAGSAELIGRANAQARPQSKQAGYYLQVADTGAWTLSKKDTAGTVTTLATGKAAALGLGSWHTLALGLRGTIITAKLGNATLATVTDTSYPMGQVGFGVVGYQTDEFDNLSITAGGGTGPIRSGLAGKCLAAKGNATTNGTPVVLTTCDGSAAESWTVSGPAIQLGGKCLDVTGQGTANGALVELWTCNGGSNQQWNAGAASSLVGAGSGRCLDDPGATTADGTQQEIWTCNGRGNQSWTLPI
jgi:ricin-type beta-trefoil lectin protein/glycosyl hydrolase family 59 (putative galactocerebrosidase)